MTDERPDPVTGSDVRGLREDTSRLADAVEIITARQDVTEAAVSSKAETKDVATVKTKANRANVIAGLAIIAVLFAGWATYSTRRQADQIISSRTQSRTALCQVLDRFATGHNRFVEQVVQERLDIINATQANPNATDAQKAASIAFFEAQIEAYRSNIVPTYDCSDPAVVTDIFKPPSG